MSTLRLASSSRYRRKLLERLGLPFETRTPAVDETEQPGESPEFLAARLAAAKAEAVAEPGTVVIGSDQVASLNGRILRKPGNHANAIEQLLECQGRAVSFHTAVCIIEVDQGKRWQHTDLTQVFFDKRSRQQIDTYLKIDQPYDCAGGFKAEGLGIALFERIDSEDPTALIGLPLIWVANVLMAAGLDPIAQNAR